MQERQPLYPGFGVQAEVHHRTAEVLESRHAAVEHEVVG